MADIYQVWCCMFVLVQTEILRKLYCSPKIKCRLWHSELRFGFCSNSALKIHIRMFRLCWKVSTRNQSQKQNSKNFYLLLSQLLAQINPFPRQLKSWRSANLALILLVCACYILDIYDFFIEFCHWFQVLPFKPVNVLHNICHTFQGEKGVA